MKKNMLLSTILLIMLALCLAFSFTACNSNLEPADAPDTDEVDVPPPSGDEEITFFSLVGLPFDFSDLTTAIPLIQAGNFILSDDDSFTFEFADDVYMFTHRGLADRIVLDKDTTLVFIPHPNEGASDDGIWFKQSNTLDLPSPAEQIEKMVNDIRLYADYTYDAEKNSYTNYDPDTGTKTVITPVDGKMVITVTAPPKGNLLAPLVKTVTTLSFGDAFVGIPSADHIVDSTIGGVTVTF